MPEFKLSRKAKADLRSIAQYTERQWGREQRNQYILQLDHSFHLLAANPELGRSCNEIRAGYRQHPQGNHSIFYRQSAEGTVEIIRILHKRMVPEEHLFNS